MQLDHELRRFQHKLHVVTDILSHLHRGRRGGDIVAIMSLHLGLDMGDNLMDLGIRHPRSLHTHWLRSTHRQEEPIALANELLGTRLVQNDSRIGH